MNGATGQNAAGNGADVAQTPAAAGAGQSTGQAAGQTPAAQDGIQPQNAAACAAGAAPQQEGTSQSSGHDAAGSAAGDSGGEGADKAFGPADNTAGDSGKGKEEGSDAETVDGNAVAAQADWNKFIETVDPALGIHPETLKGFSEIAQGMGITAESGKALLDWTKQAAERARELAAETGRQTLDQVWGANREAYQARATSVVAMLDRELGGTRFKDALERTGVNNDPDFVMGLKHIADLLQEDALGVSSDAGAAQAPESALEALQKYYK